MSTSPDPTPSESPHSKISAWQVLGHALHLFAVLAGLKLGFDFGDQVSGTLMGGAMSLICGAFASLMYHALSERAIKLLGRTGS